MGSFDLAIEPWRGYFNEAMADGVALTEGSKGVRARCFQRVSFRVASVEVGKDAIVIGLNGLYGEGSCFEELM